MCLKILLSERERMHCFLFSGVACHGTTNPTFFSVCFCLLYRDSCLNFLFFIFLVHNYCALLFDHKYVLWLKQNTRMSSLNNSAPEQLCYIPCNLCNIILAILSLSWVYFKILFEGLLVMKSGECSCSCLFETVTVRCGQCTNLCSINMAASFQSRAGKEIQVPNYTSPEYRIELGSSSSKGKNKLPKRPTNMNTTTQERVVNRPPDKRHRAPSLYNQFIKEEIQRIKLNNPDISHREAFSTAAKNWARFPHIHFGLMLETGTQPKLNDDSTEHFQQLLK